MALVLCFAGVLQREALHLHLPPRHLVGRHPLLHRHQVATPLPVDGNVLACQVGTVSDRSGAPWGASASRDALALAKVALQLGLHRGGQPEGAERGVSCAPPDPSMSGNGTNLSIVRVALGALEVVDEHRPLPRKLVPQPATATGTESSPRTLSAARRRRLCGPLRHCLTEQLRLRAPGAAGARPPRSGSAAATARARRPAAARRRGRTRVPAATRRRSFRPAGA